MTFSHGFSKLEFAVAVAVLGLLAPVLLLRLNAIQTEAERTEVDITVRNIRAGIRMAESERILRGEENRIIEIVQANPIDFLARSPDGTAGASVADPSAQWNFDAARRELVYRPRSPDAFGGATELRWRYVARVDSAGRTIGAGLIRLN